MAPRRLAVPAAPGKLPPGSADDLRRFRQFLEERHDAMRRIAGGHYKGSKCEDMILREVLIAYADEARLLSRDCLGLCSRWSSRSTTIRSIERLLEGRLIVKQEDGALWPSEGLVTFFGEQLRKIHTETGLSRQG